MERVKYSVEEVTGLKVNRVDVHVQGYKQTWPVRGVVTVAVKKLTEQCCRTCSAGDSGLERNKDRVNALNVFPVPDGDTGTNMYLTLTAALREAESVSSLCHGWLWLLPPGPLWVLGVTPG